MLDDLRFAFRRLSASPGFALAAILTLALGIGANTAIFSIADAVLFRPLPFADPGSLHLLQWRDRETGSRFTRIEYRYLKAIDAAHGGLSAVALFEPTGQTIIDGPDGAERLDIFGATANYFSLLGVTAFRGRLLQPGDERSPARPAVLPYNVWQSRFGGRDDLIGKPLALGAATFDIVGVLPKGFVLPSNHARLSGLITVLPPLQTLPDSGGTFHPLVRRDPGVTREQAQDEMNALVHPLLAPTAKAGTLPYLEDVRSTIYPVGRPIMALLLGSAALVLALGCANLASMMLTRARRREHETGIRIALGASRARLIRTLTLEAVLVGAAGATVALLVTYLTFDALLVHVPPMGIRNTPVGPDGRVLVFGIVLGLMASAAVALVPAWLSTRLDAQRLLQGRSGPRGTSRFDRVLIVGQVALAVFLVFGAAVTARALVSVLRVPLGFSAEHVITVDVRPAALKGRELQDFYFRAIETLTQRADVRSAGAISAPPLAGAAPDEGVQVNGARQPGVGLYHALPGYFDAIALTLRRGRVFDAEDVRGGASVAVISERAADILFAGRDPLGQQVTTGRARSFTVVGVVGDTRTSLDDRSPSPIYVIPHDAARLLTIMVRVRMKDEALRSSIRREVAALAPGTPVTTAWWADSLAALSEYRNPRFQALVLGSFGGIALALTATGIFGMVSFFIAVRTREMGIRIAIGATPASLVGLMLRQTLVPVGVGLLAGLVAARWAGRLAEAQLVNVDVRDPVTLAAATVTVLSTALLAAYLPARRAARVDPLAVLRAD
jgi:predicted permease